MAPCVPMLSRLALVSRLRSRAPGGWRGRRALGPGPPLVNCSSSERNGARYQRPLDCRALRARPRSKGVCARQISGTSHARRTWDVVGAMACASTEPNQYADRRRRRAQAPHITILQTMHPSGTSPHPARVAAHLPRGSAQDRTPDDASAEAAG